MIYWTVDQGNTSATAGVQRDNTFVSQYFCNGSGGGATGGQSYIYFPRPCPTPTPPRPTSTPRPRPTPLPRPISRDALTEVDRFFRQTGEAIVPLTVREILDEEIARKLA